MILRATRKNTRAKATLISSRLKKNRLSLENLAELPDMKPPALKLMISPNPVSTSTATNR
ncbi:MAG: hypothetical protein A2273_10325 [Candidatus Edwardsbacteria bacterium RifOxyA12_full_54_48]|uniref:Uncharacterized protein n=1 Tax=Candidatus Edwardsbacteria bacterium GWF2_54_11 TaxID=1817851 RepID=A0A1F5REI3_9BACT|nr:MAG: hypothetical protein A2502_01870 [Candidatus Edwardsbacteria bacterium RifOxyC12_full_54_24]OGF09013.1 MAG: hypothetical protein A2273_10325 [Candidatus Edwardsbacteria bacterium RifOxyA12_full_54_48]OGF12900.1 MAG: hypothetical protein A2024_11780 [Candidatus Edwardsbacteria bacterium GWF2_54_11]OGJ17714.1 MAG: hypothetical protein A2349_02390 [Candidatus Edwardsbacteria bacterium RifOxyB12_full_52_30]